MVLMGCQKEEAVGKDEIAASSASLAKGTTASSVTSCNCEYEIIDHGITGPIGTSGHGEYDLYTNNGSTGFVPIRRVHTCMLLVLGLAML